MKGVVFMHVEYVAHHLSNLAVYPQRVNYPGIMQALIFITLNYRKDRMRYSIRVVPNLSFKEVHSYASFVLIRLE